MKAGMCKIHFSLLVLVAAFQFSFAQTDSSKVTKKFVIRDVYASGGALSQLNHNVSLRDFWKLAPHSTLLNTDFSFYEHSGNYNFNGGYALTGSLGLNFPNKLKTYYKPSPQLRLGITYSNASYLSYNESKTDRVPFDSVSSGVPGYPYVIDSVYRYNYYMEYRNAQIRIDASMLFRTSRMKRWTFYGGYGASLGYSVASHTDVTYTYSTNLRLEENNVAPDTFHIQRNFKDTSITQTSENTGSFGYSIYVPMGFDFRFGKRNSFLSRIHFYEEIRPGLNAVFVPGFRFIHEISLVALFGIRISLD